MKGESMKEYRGFPLLWLGRGSCQMVLENKTIKREKDH